jgi:hypothetical protein
MRVVVACPFERAQYVRLPVNAWPKHSSRHLSNPTAFVVEEHLNGDRKHLVFSGAARPFFAAVTRQSVQCPRSDPLILVVEVLHEFRQCGFVHMVIENLTAADTDCRFRMI